MDAAGFDRTTEDLGNLVNLGHVNFRVPDQRLATLFYVTGLGLTRDPFMMTSTDNMWVNVGDSQFHLPTGPATIAPGIVTGLVVPDLDQLMERFERVSRELAGTKFAFRRMSDAVETVCPWGNRIRCHAPDRELFGPYRLNIAYSRFEIPRGRAGPIATFYREVMGALDEVVSSDRGVETRVSCGHFQTLIFEEKTEPAPACTDHHVQVYLADFSGPYGKLKARGVEVQENGRHQYRFVTLRDANGRDLFTLDHEVRAMTHSMYGRPLINRDASQNIRSYRAGHDHFTWRM